MTLNKGIFKGLLVSSLVLSELIVSNNLRSNNVDASKITSGEVPITAKQIDVKNTTGKIYTRVPVTGNGAKTAGKLSTYKRHVFIATKSVQVDGKFTYYYVQNTAGTVKGWVWSNYLMQSKKFAIVNKATLSTTPNIKNTFRVKSSKGDLWNSIPTTVVKATKRSTLKNYVGHDFVVSETRTLSSGQKYFLLTSLTGKMKGWVWGGYLKESPYRVMYAPNAQGKTWQLRSVASNWTAIRNSSRSGGALWSSPYGTEVNAKKTGYTLEANKHAEYQVSKKMTLKNGNNFFYVKNKATGDSGWIWGGYIKVGSKKDILDNNIDDLKDKDLTGNSNLPEDERNPEWSYEDDVQKGLDDTINKAEDVSNDPNSTDADYQEQIDNVNDEKDVMDNVNVTVKQARASLQETIDAGYDVTESDAVSTDIYYAFYDEWSKAAGFDYQDYRTDPPDIISYFGKGIIDHEVKVSKLQAETALLQKKQKAVYNRTALNALITKANALTNNSYTANSWKGFQLNLKNATTANNDYKSDNADLNLAKNNLQQAIDSLYNKASLEASINKDLLKRINAYRASYGLKAVNATNYQALQTLATRRAKDVITMGVNYDHVMPDGTSVNSYFQTLSGVKYMYAGENLDYSTKNSIATLKSKLANTAFTKWKQDGPHSQLMLATDIDFAATGISLQENYNSKTGKLTVNVGASYDVADKDLVYAGK